MSLNGVKIRDVRVWGRAVPGHLPVCDRHLRAMHEAALQAIYTIIDGATKEQR